MPPHSAPPVIFSPRRRQAARRRACAMQGREGAARYLLDDMVEDVTERLGFLRIVPERALIVGDRGGALARHLRAGGADIISADPAPGPDDVLWDEEQPWPAGNFDLIVSMATLDTVNDLPGALLHGRHALAPGGLLIASLMGAGSLPLLRAVMLAADGERPAARLHPMVDVRSGAQLLQRAGLANPVADSRGLDVRFGSFTALITDIRAQALGSVLANRAPQLSRSGLVRAGAAFRAAADSDGRATEHFEIITLSGWRAA